MSMDQIQTYNSDPDNQKVCWFPFKKAYRRRRTPSGFDYPLDAYILDNENGEGLEPVEVSLYKVNQRTSFGNEPPKTHLPDPHGIEYPNRKPINTHAIPAMLLRPASDTDTASANSIISEDEDVIVFSDLESLQLATINPNCASREFWVDEMVEGGSLTCTDDFFRVGRSLTRIGRSLGSYGSQTVSTGFEESTVDQETRCSGSAYTTAGIDSKYTSDTYFTRISTPKPLTNARIEVEYDFSKRDIFSTSSSAMDPLEQGMCGVIRGRKSQHQGTTDSKEVKTQNSAVSSTKTSKWVNSEMAPLATGPHSTENAIASNSTSRMETCCQPVPIRSSPIPPAAPANVLQKIKSVGQLKMELMEPAPLETTSRRLLCGAMAPTGFATLRGLNREHSIQEEKKTDEIQTPTAQSENHVAPMPVQPMPVNKETPSGAVPFLKSPSLDSSLRMLEYAKSFYPTGCLTNTDSRRNTQRTTDDDEFTPHFFVEVEASEQQLKVIRDLDEIEEEEEKCAGVPTSERIDFARRAPLVDDDSAFMDKGHLAAVFKKLVAPSRLLATRKETSVSVDQKHEAIFVERQGSSATKAPKVPKHEGSLRETPVRGFPFTTQDVIQTPSRDPLPQTQGASHNPLRSTVPQTKKMSQEKRPLRFTPERSESSDDTSDRNPEALPLSGVAEKDLENLSASKNVQSSLRNKIQAIKLRAAEASKPTGRPGESPPNTLKEAKPAQPPELNYSQKDLSAVGASASTSDHSETSDNNSSDRIHYPVKYLTPKRKVDTTNKLGQRRTSKTKAPDYELARFPSLSSEDWKKTIKVTKLSSRIGSRDAASAWIPRGHDDNLSANRAHEVGATFDDENNSVDQSSDHVEAGTDFDFDRVPSLEHFFVNSVPFVPVSASTQEYDYPKDSGIRISIEHSRSHGTNREAFGINSEPRLPSLQGSKGGRQNWVEDHMADDESDLNTEAFRELEREADEEDSIFHGLVESASSAQLARNEERNGTPLRFRGQHDEIEPEPTVDDRSEASRNSENSAENSVARSKYTSYTNGAFSKYSKYSTFSRGSVLTRDDMTSYTEAYSIVNEPFNCMDRWLD